MGYNVAVMGATGRVGKILLPILEERGFPVEDLYPLASRAGGRTVSFRGENVPVQVLDDFDFAGTNIVFSAVDTDIAKTHVPRAKEAGAFVVDKSSAFRKDPGVPLMIPEINGHLMQEDTRLVATPNCTTTGALMALAPLHEEATLVSASYTTMQAVSGSGDPGIAELEKQERAIVNGEEMPAPDKYPAQIARNLFTPAAAGEEEKMVHETQKILGDDRIMIAARCYRLAIPVGHTVDIRAEFKQPIEVDRAIKLVREFEGVQLVEDLSKLTPADVEGKDPVLVGGIRRDPTSGHHGLEIITVSDNLRKGAALNAVQIAELHLEHQG